MPRFDKISNCLPLDPEKQYETPEGVHVTHVGLKNGKVAFFQSPDGEDVYKSKNKWLFIKIPEGVRALIFPNAKKTKAGWNYGLNLAQ